MFIRNQRASLAYFFRAQELDSSFVGPVYFAATVHLNAREYRLADSLCLLLKSPQFHLSAFERGSVDYYEALLRGDAEVAYRLAGANFELHPGFGPYTAGLNASRTNRLEQALEYFAQQDLSLPGQAEWGGSWSQPAQVLHRLGRYEEELQLAAEIRERFPDWRLSTTVEYRALIALGRLDDMEESLETLANSRNPGNLGTTYYTAGLELRAHGFGETAPEMLDRAIRWFRALPAEELDSQGGNLKYALIAAGRWDEARSEFEALLEASPDNIDYLGGVGVIAAGEGDPDRARNVSDQLAAIDRPYLFGINTLWQAGIAAMLGERDEAVRLLRRAFDERVYHGLWTHRDIYLESLRGYEPFEVLMRPRE